MKKAKINISKNLIKNWRTKYKIGHFNWEEALCGFESKQILTFSNFFHRYHEPVGVIQLPLDPKTLTEEQLKARHRKQQSEKKIKIKEYKEDVKFDRRAMAKLMRKKK